ncbi:MAG: hypothetical protein NZ874_08375 [Fimbriimonadales bacterium]|nr:hypothetical protein [Fimbriimonadales bacterium]
MTAFGRFFKGYTPLAGGVEGLQEIVAIYLTAQAVPLQTKPACAGYEPTEVGFVCSGTASAVGCIRYFLNSL